ncbi:MAG TPA: pentapeptide repeat-containing protein [Acidimicrobiia bacterium]|nr:pentapeptide repeat-containing protein [Acidimicrobiia bacterium]
MSAPLPPGQIETKRFPVVGERQPSTYLENCNLSDVDLAGVDMRDSNLSLSDLRGANMAGTDLSGFDLEGANFAGADLREADLSGTALSATRFREEDRGADVTGARFDGSWGLAESQEDYLASRT